VRLRQVHPIWIAVGSGRRGDRANRCLRLELASQAVMEKRIFHEAIEGIAIALEMLLKRLQLILRDLPVEIFLQ
jgi:hypothetical protein